MTTYIRNIENNVDTATNFQNLEKRLLSNFEFTNTLSSSALYIASPPSIQLNFTSTLLEDDSLIVTDLIQMTIENKNIYDSPRIMNTIKTPTGTNDISGGYLIGDSVINTVNNTSYVCINNTKDNAEWNEIINTASIQTLTNKTLTATSNNINAKGLHSATSIIDVVSATAPTPGQVLKATSSTSATWQTLLAQTMNINILKDIKTNGTNGGAFTSGIWTTRVLNTLTGNGSVTLNSNIFTILPGSYYIQAFAPAYRVDTHKIQLYNTTSGTVVINGSSAYAKNSNNSSITLSYLSTYLTIVTSTNFSLQHQCSTTNNSDGFGLACGFGGTEVYSQVSIIKL